MVVPVRVGVLFDLVWPADSRFQHQADIVDALQLTLDETYQSGVLDRPAELVVRQAGGLPNGEARAVTAAWRELADEGVLCVFGPMISENAVPLREHIEAVGKVPTLSWCGAEEWLGEWCFALNNGSLPEEPYVIANVMAQDGIGRVAVAYEHSLIGRTYASYFREAADQEGLEIVGEVTIPQVRAGKDTIVERLRASEPDAVVVFGFGYGVPGMNDAMAKVGWDVPRYTVTSFEVAYHNDEMMRQFAGWIGLDQYDERNVTGQRFLDRFETRFGRRPEWFKPLFAHDAGQIIGRALGGARPLTPGGVRDAMERVKLLPAACGTPDTRLAMGQWIHRGWMGAGYLVARRMADDASHTTFHASMQTPGPGLAPGPH